MDVLGALKSTVGAGALPSGDIPGTVTTFEIRCVCNESTAGGWACPVHNQQGWPSPVAAGGVALPGTVWRGTLTWPPAVAAPPLSDADVERIARRVVELLRESREP